MRLGFRSTMVAVGACALMIGGCGSDDSAPSSASGPVDVDKVIAVAKQDKTAKIAVAVDVTGLGLAKPLNVKATGTTALDTLGLDLNLDTSAVATALAIPGLTLPPQVHAIVVKDRAALETPDSFRDRIPGKKKWIALDLAKVGGDSAKAIESVLRINVAAALEPLRKTTLENLGSETIRDVKTTHWRAQVSIDDLLSAMSPEQKKAAQTLLKRFGGTSTEKNPYDLWVDDEGRLQRSVQAVKISGAKAAAEDGAPRGAGELKIQMDLSDFGKPSAPVIPPASDSWDASEPLSQLLPAGNSPSATRAG